MAFDFETMSRTGGVPPAPVKYSYSTPDEKAVVAAAGYFNLSFTTLNVGDLITVVNITEVFVLRVLTVSSTNTTTLEVVSIMSDFYTEVAKGNVPGHSIALMQGNNPDVDLGSPENLWDLGGLLTQATTGEQLEFSSSDANDTILGTGARKVRLFYLDSNFIEQQEDIELNGLTVVPTVSTDIYRVITLKVFEVGANSENAGLITGAVVSGGANRIGIIIGGNKSLHGFYTVPAGKSAYLIYAFSTISKGKDANISIFVTGGDDGIFIKQVPAEIYQNSITLSPTAPLGALLEKSDVKFICTTENTNTSVNATLQLLLVDN